MAYDLINIGTPNANNGDTIRDAFKKSNDNDAFLKGKVDTNTSNIGQLQSNGKQANYSSLTQYNRILSMSSYGLGSNVFLSFSGTRGSYVLSGTYMVSCSHPGRTDITQLTGSNYGTLNIRALGNSQGRLIVDVDFGGATAIKVVALPLSGGTLTLNPSAVYGGDIPSGYTEYHSFQSVTRGIRTRRLVVDETIQCTSLIETSDKKYKTNIEEINGEWALTIFRKLKFSFYDNKLSNRKEAGLIAQDVEKIIPEAVHTSLNGDKAIDYRYVQIIKSAAIQYFIKTQIQ